MPYAWEELKRPSRCAGYLDPVPAPAVPSDCWLPPDDDLNDDGKEALLADLKDMLVQLRCELKHHIDASLAAHHEDIFRRIDEHCAAEQLFSPPRSKGEAMSGMRDEDLLRRLELLHNAGGLESCGVSSAPLSSMLSDNGDGCDATSPDGLPLPKASSSTVMNSYENTERIKQQAVRLLPKPPSVVVETTSQMQRARLSVKVRSCLESHLTEFFVGFLIFTNVCFLGFEVQAVRGISEEQIPLSYKFVEYFYTLAFTVELALRVIAYGIHDFFLGRNQHWNVIDFVLVSTSLLEKLMNVLLDVTSNLHYLRIIRVARTVRVLRVVRIVTFFRPLRILVYSVMNTLRSLGWTFFLLLIIIYLFAVTFTLAASQARASGEVPAEVQVELDRNFGSLWTAMFTLFKSITGGIDWTQASDSLQRLSVVWSHLFLVYIAFCNLAVLNVVTGVVCQTAIESTRQDQDIVVQSQLAIKQRYVEQLQQLFAHLDPHESGEITLQEFENHLADQELQHYFEVLELTIDEAWSLFKLLDSRGTGLISTEEFVSGCLKLRGQARSIDMHMLMYQSKWTMDRLASLMSSVGLLERDLQSLQEQQKLLKSQSRRGSRDVVSPVSPQPVVMMAVG